MTQYPLTKEVLKTNTSVILSISLRRHTLKNTISYSEQREPRCPVFRGLWLAHSFKFISQTKPISNHASTSQEWLQNAITENNKMKNDPKNSHYPNVRVHVHVHIIHVNNNYCARRQQCVIGSSYYKYYTAVAREQNPVRSNYCVMSFHFTYTCDLIFGKLTLLCKSTLSVISRNRWSTVGRSKTTSVYIRSQLSFAHLLAPVQHTT